jgi:hypothetical protein
MRSFTAAAAVVALSLIVVPETPAQVVVSQSWASAPRTMATASYSPAYVPPYSYYAAWPWPARGYVPYGPGDQFPFYGQPYGHPYDRWTWPYLGGGYNRYLARYYYPPIP